MPRPYEYRDYPLTMFMAIVAAAGTAWLVAANIPERVEVSFAGRCCGDTDCPTVSKLAELPSVTDVRHEDVAAKHTIFLKAGREVTARNIWDALASTDHPPARMVFGRCEFSERPIR